MHYLPMLSKIINEDYYIFHYIFSTERINIEYNKNATRTTAYPIGRYITEGVDNININVQNLIMTSVQSVIRQSSGHFELFAEIKNSNQRGSAKIAHRLQHNQLYCRTGFHLIIKANGLVRGTRDQYNSYSKSFCLLDSLVIVYFRHS